MANLLAPPQQPQAFSPTQAGSSAIPQIGTGVYNSLGTPRPVNQIATFSPQPQINFSQIAFPKTPAPITAASTGGVAKSTVQPVSTPGSSYDANYAFPTDTSTLGALSNMRSVTLPNGKQATIDAQGNIIGAPTSFSIDTSGSVPSSALGSSVTGNDVQSKYSQYLDQLAKAYQPSQDYLNALNAYQGAQQQGMQIKADALTSPTYPGDTYGFAQGVEGRQTALNALQQTAAGNNLNVQQTIRQSNIDAAKALASGYAPQTVGIGSSLVSPGTGQPIYQSDYLFKPSASQINTVAQQLMQSGLSYSDAYNQAQQIVTNAAQGNQAFAPGTGSDVQTSPVYQNAMSLLNQGIPFDQVLSSLGKTTAAKSYAQQALNDFLGGNTNYNAAAAKAGYSFRQNAGAQTFIVNAKTAEDNIDKLVQLSDSFPRSQFQVTNMAQLYALAQSGNTDAVNLYTYATMLGDDLGKLLGSTGGSDYTTKLGQAMFNPNYSATQMSSIAKSVKGVINDKVTYYNQAFTQGGSSSGTPSGGSTDMSAYSW